MTFSSVDFLNRELLVLLVFRLSWHKDKDVISPFGLSARSKQRISLPGGARLACPSPKVRICRKHWISRLAPNIVGEVMSGLISCISAFFSAFSWKRFVAGPVVIKAPDIEICSAKILAKTSRAAISDSSQLIDYIGVVDESRRARTCDPLVKSQFRAF